MKNKKIISILLIIICICIALFIINYISNINENVVNNDENVNSINEKITNAKESVDNINQNDIKLKKDVIYKTVNGEDLKLDIYMPLKNVYDKIPVSVYIHGGAFIGGSKDNVLQFQELVTQMQNKGYAVISIDYRLLNGNNIFPDNLEDCKDALRWVNKNADKYNFDINNIGVWGASAGGHLSLMMAYTNDNDFIGDNNLKEYSSKVNWVIDFFGSTDFNSILDITDESLVIERVKLYYNMDIDSVNFTSKEKYILNNYAILYSPLSYVELSRTSTFIIHGTDDTTVDISQSNLLYEKLQDNNVKSEYLILDNVDHGLVGINNKQKVEILSKIDKFLDENYVN